MAIPIVEIPVERSRNAPIFLLNRYSVPKWKSTYNGFAAV
jgi:hypothetical protein